ncbi:DUF4153 domain-containing protein [Psychrobium sp. 1_MG-2023]|uniref:DUF4153 domain-containing protein n=1 Tax=Psychrobium sp. 1_MG-2023 TaxID=3062624 RepID=UPI000C325435|nr:DUF4153 domain-containing protein [Psychrobium sp. 1_MG-2023]MDP2562305.1 DUF4153 domain-containing protein [Psychrobium sp. 1_MG-2023]PKF54688.1 hypothetical protein CW748_15635 [Alteromonadales bacterium alter-6D02]
MPYRLSVHVLLGMLQGILLALNIAWWDSWQAHQTLLLGIDMGLMSMLLFLQLCPEVLQSNVSTVSRRYSWLPLFVLSMFLGFTSYYVALQDVDELYPLWVVSALVLSYITLPFIQLSAAGFTQPNSWCNDAYHQLFVHSWSNVLIVGFALFFTSLYWLVIVLWVTLFSVIGIAVFEDIFYHEWFAWPTLGAAFGVGLYMAMSYQNIITSLKSLLLSICKMLLPLVAFLTVIFVANLPFSGLDGVWSTGFATPLILVLIALNIFLFNGACYPKEALDSQCLHFPYPSAVRWLVLASIASLSILIVIAAYSVSLRVGQYGWTPPRVYLSFAVMGIGAYVLSYLTLLIKPQASFCWLKRANVMSTGLVIIMLSVGHSPWLNPLTVSVNSQLARLHQQQVTALEFDYGALKFGMGQVGQEALEQLANDTTHSEFEVINSRLTLLALSESAWQWQDALHDLNKAEAKFVWPLQPLISAERLASLIEVASCLEKACALFPIDLNSDGESEVLFFDNNNWGNIEILDEVNNRWQVTGYLPNNGGNDEQRGVLLESLRQGAFELQPARYQDVRVGDKVFRVQSH